jgi:hypothetical protein
MTVDITLSNKRVPKRDPLAELDALFVNSPGERDVQVAMAGRQKATATQDADQFLDDLISSSPTVQQERRTAAAQAKPTPSPAAKATMAETSTLGAVIADVGRGMVEAPRQILGGARDAAQSAVELVDWLGDALESKLQLGGVQLFDEKWSFAPEYIPAGDERIDPKKQNLGTLPTVKEPATTTGGAVRGVSQFLTGFAAAGPILGTAARAAPVAGAAAKGAVSDFTAFGGHEKRLSNLIQDVPALQNPVTEYLAASPNDGEIEGRLKNAIEGAGLGAAAEGVFRGIRYIRDQKRTAAAADPTAAAARAEAEPAEAAPLALLGDEAAPLTASGEKALGYMMAEGGLGVPDDVAARSLTPNALTPLTGGKDGIFVNFARINTEDDVKRVIADTANAFSGEINASRRGVRSNAATMEAAGAEDAWNILSSRSTGEALNAEQSVAVRRLWEASAAKLLEVADAAAKAPTVENLFQFRKMMAVHSTVQSQVISARTETARALQSWAIPVEAGGAARMRSIESALASFGGTEAAVEMAKRVAAFGKVPNGLQALDQMVEKGVFAKSLDTVKELWINALLSGPKTHLVNIMSNTATTGISMIERFAASGISRSIGSGEIMPGEAAAYSFAVGQGAKEGFRMFLQAMRTGQSQFGEATTKTADIGFDRAISSANWKVGGDGGIKNPANWMAHAIDGLGFVANLPTRTLTAEDDFFKSIGYRMELHAQAFREATREAQDGLISADAVKPRIAGLLESPPENIKMRATDSAIYSTFTSKPGAVVSAINRMDRELASGSPGARLGSFAMRMLMPFRNTPANLMKYSFERTPLAPLMGRYREAMARGGADADIAMTRMAMGTMTLLAVADMALDGHVTGGGPRGNSSKDRGTRETLQRSGWQPYSVKVGDRYFSYARTDPIGMSIGIAADIAEIINNADMDEDKAEDLWEAAAAATAAFGNQMLDKTYLSGLSGFIETLHNPDRSSSFFERMAAGFVPAALNQARQFEDPSVRYTNDLVTALKNKIPGLSEDLPLARDYWGRERSFQSGMGTVYDAVSPIASKVFDPEPIDREAIANDFNMAMPNWTIGKIGLRNRPAIYSRMLEVRGSMKPSEIATDQSPRLIKKYGDVALLPLLNSIVEGKHKLSAAYVDASPGRNGGKDSLITRIVGDYSKAAKERMLDEFPEIGSAD